MFSIGEFARLGQVSVRMLRHYDEIGVLRPARVDRIEARRSRLGFPASGPSACDPPWDPRSPS